MKVQELGRGLWRWAAPHPDWEPPKEKDSPADWPELVGSVAYDCGDTLVLVDPLVPDDGWAELDRLARDRKVRVLTTIAWHRRSRGAVVERYGGVVSNARATLPDGVELITIEGAREHMVWISEHGALVPGDRLLGDGDPLRVCPDSWMRYLKGFTGVELRRELRKLLDLPVRMILTSHGEPVLHDARAALEGALAE
ncbi:MAG: hypothetical protein WAQ33_10430 [Gaiellaceae bacterium]